MQHLVGIGYRGRMKPRRFPSREQGTLRFKVLEACFMSTDGDLWQQAT